MAKDMLTPLLDEEDPLLGKPVGNLPGTSVNRSEFLDPQGKYKLVMKGGYSAVEVAVVPEDDIKAEAGAMVTMSHNVGLVVKLEGTVGGAALRSCCAGDGMFFTHYQLLEGSRGDVLLAPALPGDVVLLTVDSHTAWTLAKHAYLASDTYVVVSARRQGLAAGCCSSEGFFVLECSGAGRLLVNSFGGVMRYDLAPGETRKIDNGFLVAWSSDMPYTMAKAGRTLTASILSGEGLVTAFVGPGTVYVQTRALSALASALRPYLRS